MSPLERDKQEWVRIDPKMTERNTRLLVSVAESLGEVATRAAVVRQVASALSDHILLRSFEMGWREGGDFICIQAHRELATWKVSQAPTGHKRLGLVRDGLREKKVMVSLVSPEGWKQVLLPFYEHTQDPGYAYFEWEKGEIQESDLPYALLEPLRRVLMFAQKNLARIERVAAVSQRAHKENKRLKDEVDLYVSSANLVAISPKMRAVMENARRVARYDSTVLLLGESGTGKERLSRNIHQMSRRARKPFIQVNCGALPEGLVESELFGHEKGAFTGATRRHIGCFERADGGTLLLDEVAELPLPAQVKLLRVLQEGTLTRVGGETQIEVDVRIIAATHQSLETLVAQKAFRDDLFFRLNVFPLYLPPLRERSACLPVLAHQVLGRIAKKLRSSAPQLQPTDLEMLQSYDWPGNIRELENILERALIFSSEGGPAFSHALAHAIPGAEVHLPAAFSSNGAAKGGAALSSMMMMGIPGQENGHQVQMETWDEAVRRCITEALAHAKGRIYGEEGAAELLQLKPSTLQSKMKKLGIERGAFKQ